MKRWSNRNRARNMFAGAQAKLAKSVGKCSRSTARDTRADHDRDPGEDREHPAQRSSNPSLCCRLFRLHRRTSTGAVIGTLLALGKPADEIRRIYLDCGRMMFDKNTITGRLEKLARTLHGRSVIETMELVAHYAKRWQVKERPTRSIRQAACRQAQGAGR